MGRKKAVVEEPAVVEAGTPVVPPGNPLTWSVEDWLTATGVPVDQIGAELARLAQQQGAAGLPWQMLKNVWDAHTSPAQREAGVRYILEGLVALAQTGEGPTSHAGAELA